MSSRSRLAILGLILFLSACFSEDATPAEKLSHIVSFSASCTAPCWNSLVPGVSTETDIARVVDSAPASAFSDLRRQRFADDEINMLWTDEDIRFFGGIYLKDGVVEHIRFQTLQNDLTLGMVREQLGEPDGYEASELENEYIDLVLYFEDSGVIVAAWFEHTLTELRDITNACEYEPDWRITPERLEIGFVEPTTMNAMADTMHWIFFTRDPEPWDDGGVLALTQSCSQTDSP